MCRERLNKSNLKGLFLLVSLLFVLFTDSASLLPLQIISSCSSRRAVFNTSLLGGEMSTETFFQAPFKLAYRRGLSEDEGFWVSVAGPELIWALLI